MVFIFFLGFFIFFELGIGCLFDFASIIILMVINSFSFGLLHFSTHNGMHFVSSYEYISKQQY